MLSWHVAIVWPGLKRYTLEIFRSTSFGLLFNLLCPFSFLIRPFLVLLALQSPMFPLEKVAAKRQGKW